MIRAIKDSVGQLRQGKNSVDETKFFLKMILSLQALDMSQLSDPEVTNVKMAIEVFRLLQGELRSA